jgi:G3E family GTPase
MPRSFLRLIHTLPNIIHQVEAADIVLLNKCDLFDEEQLTETEQAVLNIKPEAHLVRCVKGEADFDVLGKAGKHAGCRVTMPSAATHAILLSQ